MVSNLTHLSAKEVQELQPHRSIKWCEKQLRDAKAALKSKVVLVKHLAEFWCVDEEDIITQLRPRFAV
jgi:hypothetical protein